MATGDVTQRYATKATVTVTLASLANGSARESTVIDNTTDRYSDFIFRILTKGQGLSTAQLNVYAYAALSDTVYTDGATGSDAAFTAAKLLNSVLVVSVQMNAANAVTSVATVRQAFGGSVPSKFGFIFVNASGAALSATGGDHVVEVQGVYANVSA